MHWALQLMGVAIGGALGGAARFWLSGLVARRIGETFPWGTLVVNLSGAFAIGVLAALLTDRPGHAVLHASLWTGLVIGVLGSYTTVSSFSLQTLALLRDGEYARAVGNVAASLIGCLAAVSAGYLLMLQVWGRG
ncbi:MULTISPECIES: fluoride efflux transporter CrcB [Luteimonas]|uniref:Fluoride-specific ion channel FluC n=1 Tax=Luteimonas terrae TaxID=1530191 RepID=A0ABU1XRI3_9GAMM|nr:MULTISPECIES: fluoride efflux transporter CrcB [Luteimonas]MDR6991977.1 CrcB protein [Luteimonas sp. 3794]MDR7191357.1 CrcB protein [Luteimonas terrae]